uniref:Uncharacterized protein n=1 Tax=Arundo donax TaxID=35708 RepID=A0A0A9ATQ0_ARUDO
MAWAGGGAPGCISDQDRRTLTSRSHCVGPTKLPGRRGIHPLRILLRHANQAQWVGREELTNRRWWVG